GRFESLADGVRRAEQTIDSGAATAALAGFVELSTELAPR
ncbi:MAG: anthranilate phosphoribosyltransferase, partial [Thermoleophilaceae bacterium]|nr:anthranilate phosphoribosyltransferase [Thermoleophilaceae bacterium]